LLPCNNESSSFAAQHFGFEVGPYNLNGYWDTKWAKNIYLNFTSRDQMPDYLQKLNFRRMFVALNFGDD
jgi:hypothetical protein